MSVSRVKLYLVAAIFLCPVLLAGYLYFSKNTAWIARRNHGQLIEPLIAMREVTPNAKLFEHHWSLTYLVDSNVGCSDACLKSLYQMRQIYRTLGKDMNRVQRVILLPERRQQKQPVQARRLIALIKPRYPQLKIGVARGVKFSGLVIVDPRGNLMMRYQSWQTMKAVQTDLKRLLQVSQIG